MPHSLSDTPASLRPLVKRLDATGTSRHRAVTTAGRLHPPRRGSCAECPPPSARHRPPCHTPFVRVKAPAPKASVATNVAGPQSPTRGLLSHRAAGAAGLLSFPVGGTTPPHRGEGTIPINSTSLMAFATYMKQPSHLCVPFFAARWKFLL